MALDLNISDAAAIAAVDALLAEIDAGGTTNNGKLYIYDNTQARGFKDLIKCVDRELALRRNVYRKRVETGKMKSEVAQREIRAMEDIRAILVALEPLANLVTRKEST